MAKNTNLTILEQLFRSKNIYSVLYNLKTLRFSDSSKKIKQALKHPIALNVLFHESSLSQDYSQLRNKRSLPFSNNLEGEIAWFIQSLSKFSDLINEFIKIERNFENNVLLDNYDLALVNLEKIENTICKSFWGIENLFSTVQNQEGDESNWALLKDLNSETDDYYTLLFIANYSKKAESEMTLLQYKRGIEAEINSMSKADYEYLLFKLGYFFIDDYSEYAYIINSENSSSIIDKYSTLIDVVSELSNSLQHVDLVKEILIEFDKLNINDSRINRLKELNGINVEIELNVDLINLFDIYSLGNYKDSIQECRLLLKKYPECLEIYEIYIRSIIELDNVFINSNASSFIDYILKNLFSIYTRDSDYYIARENLLKIYLTYPRLNFFKRLLGLVSTLTGIKSMKDVLNNNQHVYSRYSNPSLVIIKSKLANYYSDNDALKNHISYKINYAMATEFYDDISELILPENKLEVYKSRGAFINNNYTNTISLLEKLLEKDNLKSYVEEEAIYILFHSYLIEENFSKAVTLMIDSYFKNKFYVERLNGDLLYNYIIQSDYTIIPSIDLPIFFYLNNANSYHKYVALDIYLNSIGVDKPSQIDGDWSIEVSKEKYMFLLDKICDLKVLNYFYSVYVDDIEVLDERKEILRKLISVDMAKSTNFLEELVSITQKEKIKSIIQFVNDGKIRLNFSRIKDDKDTNLENNFKRFLKFSEFTKKNNLTIVDTHVLIENYLSELSSDSTKLQDASFVQFKSVFFEIVEHFLFSEEHGLEGDISTRIRHGVLENQIRKIFLNTNLIALKDKKSNYEDISYWNEFGKNEGYLDEVIIKFQDVLKRFSKSIDDKIDFIVNEQMQIYSNRYTKKKKGLFNFYYPEESLWVLYKETSNNVENYEDFLNFSFDILKEYTDALLFNIREYFRDKLNVEFNGFMEELELEIKKLFPLQADIFSELFQVINNTKVSIQKELDLISEWFKVSNPVLDTSLDLQSIIETSVESINLIQAKNKINANISAETDTLLQGFDYYIIIFQILLDNIIKHSGIESYDIFVDIKASSEIVKIEDNDLTCFNFVISNKIQNVQEEELKAIFGQIKENWETRLDKVNIEGGSGFQKIKRILKYDVKSFENDFNYEVINSKVTVSLKFALFYKGIDNE